ncbi:phosphoadenylyl-sulfate reductase [Corynebacterium xerosis]|jgi:phosphoadenosine phosphosulfate reductase|uniref:Adenosine 5'-phosphosulfate reductase n=1 Tax=Corynebacterium xerosis TaxID=1725 RepID=A0A2N6SWW4_9CORY|nr:phosphoadenylyl-sulfate reductase [Corynebacterium xerosis]MDY0113134.1 phosphoadenylyl-sulfate reductase [Corynebacterium sp.]PMC61562.1 phosphoadenylyl-sulfate reductase [Corynebacterium xerosis]QGS34310.1 phosphoadenylyl-sulfate reductase [Corynebacterium xerosis]
MSTTIQPSTENPDVLADPAVARRLLELALDHGPSLEKLSAGEIIEWGAEHLGTNLAVTMSMQDTVLAELAARHAPDADLIFLDTGYHFPETIEVADAVDKRYPNRLLRIQPVAGAVPELYKTDMTACCAQRKVEPLARMKLPYEGWVTGLKRVDAPTRKNTPVLEIDKTGRIKLNPLASWTDDDVDQFIEDNDLIIHPLTKAGFPSIGCAPCTNRVAPGADPRSGRWAGAEKTECGLHT